LLRHAVRLLTFLLENSKATTDAAAVTTCRVGRASTATGNQALLETRYSPRHVPTSFPTMLRTWHAWSEFC